MLKLTKFSLKNPFAIIMICFLLIGGGIYSFTTFKTDLLPDIEFPVLTVSTVYPGASPQDVDDNVTVPLEDALSSLEGLTEIKSQSRDSLSRLELSFPLDSDLDRIESNINEAINNNLLPEDAEVSITRFSFSSLPVVSLALFPATETNESGFEEWVEGDLRSELLNISGVNSVVVAGTSENYLTMFINKDETQRLALSLNQIREEIERANFSFPAGTMENEDGSIPIRIDQRVTERAEIEELTITSPINQEKIKLGDIATFEETIERRELTRYNQQDSVSLNIFKRQDVNTIEVASDIYTVLDRYPERADYAVNFDQATDIQASIDGLIEKGLLGALFTSLIVLLFLRNIRATAIALISIPLSLLIGAIFMSGTNITLNVMSLAGMAVAVGRVVDDSIIVIENVYRKASLQPTMDRTELTIAATAQMKNPILTSTITSLVVFLPLGLVGGVTGAFFLPFALTIVFTLLASLFVAITLVPILSRFSFLKIKEKKQDSSFIKNYEKIIRAGLQRKWAVLSLAFVLLFGSIPFATQLGFVFLPNEENRILQADVTLPQTSNLEQTDEVASLVEESLEQNRNDYQQVFVSIGSFDFQSGQSMSNKADFYIDLGPNISVDQALNDVQQEIEDTVLPNHPQAIVSVVELETSGPPTNNNIDIDLFSDQFELLDEAALQVEALMLEREDIRYVQNNLQDKQYQWTIKSDPLKMNEAGLEPGLILGIIADQTRPISLGDLTLDGQQQTLQLRYNRDLTNAEDLEDIMLFGDQGPIPLTDVAEINREEVISSIQKLDGQQYARVSAQVVGDNVLTVTNDVTEAVQQLNLPEGVQIIGGGGSDETLDTFIDLLVAIVVSIGLVYITLLIFFGKARLPLIILTSLIFVPIGSILALWLANEPLSISAMIGLLMLVGIVVTNAVVLIDRINQNRSEGLLIREAVVESAKTRLRPILMTAFATIAALLPLAFATPEGGLISRGLALVVIGGLTTSTFLTLIFVPVIYEIAFYRERRREVATKGSSTKTTIEGES